MFFQCLKVAELFHFGSERETSWKTDLFSLDSIVLDTKLVFWENNYPTVYKTFWEHEIGSQKYWYIQYVGYLTMVTPPICKIQQNNKFLTLTQCKIGKFWNRIPLLNFIFYLHFFRRKRTGLIRIEIKIVTLKIKKLNLGVELLPSTSELCCRAHCVVGVCWYSTIFNRNFKMERHIKIFSWPKSECSIGKSDWKKNENRLLFWCFFIHIHDTMWKNKCDLIFSGNCPLLTIRCWIIHPATSAFSTFL